MSTTLNLAERLLAMGRNYQFLGRNQDALHILGRLSGLRHLQPEVAEQMQVCLAEVCLARRKLRQARRHLAAALRYQPDNARYHFLMGRALAADPKGDRQRAADHFRKSLANDPDDAERLTEFGLFALELGLAEEGLRCLYRAVEVAPDDPGALSGLLEGLESEHRMDEARKVLRAALFRNARDRRFRQVWQEFQFRQLGRAQHRRRSIGRSTAQDAGPVLLPFVQPSPAAASGRPAPRILRADPPSSPPSPHTRATAKWPNQQRRRCD
jgi:tetratricopeptide (TPR) repeat protein